jgi:intracellular multiplication protein IcmD
MDSTLVVITSFSERNKMSKFSKFFKGKKGLGLFLVGSLLISSAVFAAGGDATDGLELSAISSTIGGTVTHVSVILSNIALIAGIAFVLASFFKFHQHKLNPTQVPLSQGVTLLLIGAGLSLMPLMVPTAKNAVFGSTAKVSQIKGSGMTSLIGGKT